MECRREKERYKSLILAALVLVALIALWPAGRVNAEDLVGWTLPKTINNLSPTKTIQVEVGQKFYISDFLIENEYFVPMPVSSKKAVYSSDNSRIASVKNGCVTAKKTGTAKITAKYNKKNYVCTLKVVKQGSLKSTTTYKQMNALANKIAQAYSVSSGRVKVTSSNFLKLAKAVAEYRTLAEKYKKKLNADRGYLLKTNKLVVPMASKVSDAEDWLEEYASDIIVDKMEQAPKRISKVSAKSGSSTFTISLKNKLSMQQFYLFAFFLNRTDFYDAKVTFGKKPVITVKDTLNGSRSWTTVDEFGDDEVEIEDSDGYVLYTLKPGTAKVTAELYHDKKCKNSRKLIKDMEYSLNMLGIDIFEDEYTFKAK